jgi:hypothetical protein
VTGDGGLEQDRYADKEERDEGTRQGDPLPDA